MLALVVQASGFGTAFRVFSIGLTSVILILGTLTGIRVLNASQDDAAMIVGMNRLRAAYVEMDPELATYFVESWHDDQAGLMQTYLMGQKRHLLLHILGSTSMFMTIINTLVAGTLGALIAWAGGVPVVLIAILGAVAGLAYLAAAMEISRRAFVERAGRCPLPDPAGRLDRRVHERADDAERDREPGQVPGVAVEDLVQPRCVPARG